MKSAKADEKEQSDFIEQFQQFLVFLFILTRICKVPLKVVFTDEASLRRDGTIHYGWYKKGITPEILESGGRFESIKLIGAVDQEEGSFHLKKVSDKMTMDVYLEFLAYLSDKYKDKLLIIVHDNAPWHGVKKLPGLLLERGLQNIIIIRLPKYSPEMNPCERLWNWMRESVTHCRHYESLKELNDSIWRFYRRAYNRRDIAKIRFRTEKPVNKLSVNACRKGIATFY